MPARIDVETGPMFSAKSWKLIERIQEAEHRDQKVLAIRPMTDRHTEPFIIARKIVGGKPQAAIKYPARIIETRQQFRLAWSDPEISLLAIDEGQFFPTWIVAELKMALCMRQNEKFRMVVAGLNLDYARKEFGQMPRIMAIAAKVRVHAGVCMKCKRRAGRYTQRLKGSTDQVLPGDLETYEVRCLSCHTIFTGE